MKFRRRAYRCRRFLQHKDGKWVEGFNVTKIAQQFRIRDRIHMTPDAFWQLVDRGHREQDQEVVKMVLVLRDLLQQQPTELTIALSVTTVQDKRVDLVATFGQFGSDEYVWLIDLLMD